MARITINGERAQLAVRAYVDPALWDVRTGLAAGRSAAASELNEKLLLIRRRIERCYETLLARQAAVTPALVREMYFGNDRQQETLLAFFRQHNEEFGRMVGVSRSKSSYYKYRSVYRLLAAYVRERCRRADIPFRELDKRFLAGFHQYIARESPHKKNTAWVYMIAFKHILMLARSRDLLSADLFAGYRLRSEFVARDYLTETEIRRLMLLAPTDRTQRLVLDAFLFSCFTGLSYIDIRQLKPANIRYTQGQLWIGTTRRKTGSEVYVRLFAVPNAILSRYLTDAADEPIFAPAEQRLVQRLPAPAAPRGGNRAPDHLPCRAPHVRHDDHAVAGCRHRDHQQAAGPSEHPHHADLRRRHPRQGSKGTWSGSPGSSTPAIVSDHLYIWEYRVSGTFQGCRRASGKAFRTHRRMPAPGKRPNVPLQFVIARGGTPKIVIGCRLYL